MDFCWQCLAPYGRSAPPQPVGAGMAQTVGDPSSPTGVAAGPLARPGGSAITEALRGPSATGTSSVPSEGPTGTSWIPAVVKVVVFLALAAGGFVGWRLLVADFAFPEEIAGQPQIEGERAERVSEFMEGLSSVAAADIELAVYGRGSPTYMMARTEFEDADALDFLIQNAPGFEQLRGGGLMCGPEVQGSSCSWLEGDRVVLTVGGFVDTPEALRPIAEDVRADLD
jgi:hypothetical protein